MNTRKLLLILPLLLMIGACSDDDPAAPANTRNGLGFETFAVGDFFGGSEAGYSVIADDMDGPGDATSVVEAGGGDIGLKDADNTNTRAAKLLITSVGQQLFNFESMDVSDLTGIADITAGSEIRVRGFRSTEEVATRYYRAESASVTTENAGSLQGLALTALRIDIKSTGDDDFCVSYVELEPVAERMLDFVGVPVGAFDHMFVGAYELTREAGGERPLIVDDDTAPPFAGDDTSDELSSIFVIERTDGGVMRLEGLVGINLEGAETHNESRILLEGYDDVTLAGSVEIRPNTTAPTDFDAGGLDGVDVTSLRVDIKSVCGTYRCDDMGLSGLLITNVD